MSRRFLKTLLRRPTADATSGEYVSNVVGNKSDAAGTGAVTTGRTLVAYLKQLVTYPTIAFAQSTVVSSGIPNNTQTGGAITAAATGAVQIEDIIFETDATGLAAPTNIEITCDNVNGLTGAAAPLILEPIASFGANLTVSKKDTTYKLPMTIESGKKLYIHGDDAAGTGAGEARITIIYRPLASGATLTGADIAAP